MKYPPGSVGSSSYIVYNSTGFLPCSTQTTDFTITGTCDTNVLFTSYTYVYPCVPSNKVGVTYITTSKLKSAS